MVEYLTRNEKVEGSSPFSSSIKARRSKEWLAFYYFKWDSNPKKTKKLVYLIIFSKKHLHFLKKQVIIKHILE